MGEDLKRNLLVIKASAGSGKTYTLAKEYIKHLLFSTGEDGTGRIVPRRHQGDTRPLNAHRLLLAITFTNKATDEMKSRIVSELHHLAQPGVDSDYLQGFMDESGLDEMSVRILARQALNELLFDYSNFNVSTIDSFFQGILRNFARELDRDFNYDIQLDEKYAVRSATHSFLLTLGRAPVITAVDKWVKEYQRHLINDKAKTKQWKFFKDDGGNLSEFASIINSEEFRGKMDEIRSYLGTVDENGEFVSDFSHIQRFKAWVNHQIEAQEALIAQSDADLIQYLAPMASSLKGALSNFYEKGVYADKSPLKDADDTKIASQFRVGQVPDGSVISHITGLVANHFNGERLITFLQAIGDNLGLLGMLGMIDVHLERFRHETNSILIGDTNELIGTVLESGSAFVYERVGSSISHFMIDEFQDTSSKQYENFKGLLHESLASGNFNMLIGDAKQSIYRFRNADPTVFREKVDQDFKNDITDGLDENSRPAPGEPTSTNYRSSRRIIEFNNSLFEHITQRYADHPTICGTYQDYLQAMPADIDKKKLPGYVRLYTDKYHELANDRFIHDILAEQGDLPGAGEPLNSIDTLKLLPAYLLKLHQRYRWGQIGILVYTNSDGQQVVQRILEYNQRTSGEQIKVISGESLQLNNSPIIRRIIAMLRFIDACQFTASEDSSDDEVSDEVKAIRENIKRKLLNDQRLYSGLSRFIQAIAAHSRQADLTPDEVGTILLQSLDAVSTSDGNEDGTPTDEFARTLSELLPGKGELATLTSIIETIIAHFKREAGKGANLEENELDRETAFLMAFQDTVAQFCSQHNGGSVREFLRFWDEKKDMLAMSSDENGDSVNVMTIHKAKGLEFDCVVLPFANWQIDGNYREDKYWVTRDVFIDAISGLPMDGSLPEIEEVPPLVRIDAKVTSQLIEQGVIGGKMRDHVVKSVTDATIDNLNKTYVALTRPCIEMHIFCGTDTDRKRHNHMKPLLTDFARGSGFMHPITLTDGTADCWFEYGEPSTAAEIADFKRSQENKDQQEIPLNLPIKQYSVSDIPAQLRVRSENMSSAHIKAGVRLHSLMSRIGDRDDVERIIAQGVKHGTISSEGDDLCSLASVNAHVRIPIMDKRCRVAAWFDPANKVYSERTITTASSQARDGIENLRPDRIVLLPDGRLVVIDYKTGQRDDKRYCRQVKQYISKLRAMGMADVIEGRIWYIAYDTIIDENGNEVDFKL